MKTFTEQRKGWRSDQSSNHSHLKTWALDRPPPGMGDGHPSEIAWPCSNGRHFLWGFRNFYTPEWSVLIIKGTKICFYFISFSFKSWSLSWELTENRGKIITGYAWEAEVLNSFEFCFFFVCNLEKNNFQTFVFLSVRHATDTHNNQARRGG